MEFENLICGSCGGTDFHKLSDLEYRCNHCRGLLVRSEKWETPRPLRPAMPERETDEATEFTPFFVKAMVGLVIGVFVMIVLGVLIMPKSGPNSEVNTKRFGPLPYNVSPPPPAAPVKLKVNVIGKVKGSFDRIYIKCMVTNTGQTVINEPSVALVLYKDDIKLDTVYGDAGLKYLKPGVTTPIWVRLRDQDYTSAVFQENRSLRGIDNPERIFPELKFSDTAMKIETGTSSMNGQPYKEKFFTVSGVIQNELHDKVSPELFVTYFDSKNQVVGVRSGKPAELTKGEKTRFEVTAGETQLFGVPVRFEILTVDPTLKTGPCLANKIC